MFIGFSAKNSSFIFLILIGLIRSIIEALALIALGVILYRAWFFTMSIALYLLIISVAFSAILGDISPRASTQ